MWRSRLGRRFGACSPGSWAGRAFHARPSLMLTPHLIVLAKPAPKAITAEALALDFGEARYLRAGHPLFRRSRRFVERCQGAVAAIRGPSARRPKATNPTSAGVVRMTGMAFGGIGATTEFGSVVRKPKSSCWPSTGALFGPRAPRQEVHKPAKANSGRSSLTANHFGVLRGFVSAYSQNDVAGTMQRFCLPSQPRQ